MDNFEVLWHTFQENYAFFDVRGVDWQAQYDQFRPQVKPDMSESALYKLMSDMLSSLNDAHVFLWSQAQSAYNSYKDNPSWIYNEWLQEKIIDNYLGGYGNIKAAGKGKLIYGKLNDLIGYLNVKGESGYAKASLDEAEAAGAAIDQVLHDLGDVKAIIVDARFNGGGYDGVSLALASRFTDQRRLAHSYAIRNGDCFTPAYEKYLEPGGERQFTKPVYLLTSNYTLSGGEIFVLDMRTLPNVTIIGEKTRGCFGAESYGLPNGWWFAVPDYKVIASDGEVFEGAGIPPDIEMAVNYDTTTKDDVLEKALALAGEIK